MPTYKISSEPMGISGILRYGHYEGKVEVPEEDVAAFESNPAAYILKRDLQDSFDIVIDSYKVYDHEDMSEDAEIDWWTVDD